MKRGPISEFMLTHYKHFNSASLVDAAKGWETHLAKGGKMFLTMAGAMSTAELGKSLAEVIRQGKVHAICCTGANLEEDIYNLVAHNHYHRIPDWRALTADEEEKLLEKGLNRVTDTCIPEDEAMRKIESLLNKEWQKADAAGESHPPHYYFWQLLKNPEFKKEYQIDPKDSWMIAAMEKNLPIYTPGWEDSTNGNMYTAAVIEGRIKNVHTVNSGIQTMMRLAAWYTETSANTSIGFFQIGGGIAGDFPICVVPMLEQDLDRRTPLWGYFCQISDSTTSYGSYSGAVPNEKITWGKLDRNTPKYIIESDATIVAPLVFAYLLNW